MDGEFAKSVMDLVENYGDIEDRLSCGQSAVTFDVTSHAVDDVCHGFSRVRVIGVIVDDGLRINGPIRTKWEESLVPMDVTREIQIDTILE